MKYLFLVFALNFVQQRLGIALVMLGNEASYQKEKERKKKKKVANAIIEPRAGDWRSNKECP